MEAILYRKYNGQGPTLGRLVVLSPSLEIVFQCATVELPWRDNAKGRSCIPEGVYEVTRRYSARFKRHYLVNGTGERELILIHVANSMKQLRGCIAPGMRHSDIDRDGLMDVASSGQALNMLLKIAPAGFRLKVVSMEDFLW